MDRKLLDNQGLYERDEQDKQPDDKNIFPKQTETIDRETPLEILSQTLDHYFPQFNNWLEELSDRRKPAAISYSKTTIVWTALMAVLSKQGSRKRISDHMRSIVSGINLCQFSRQSGLDKVPHADTVEYFFLGTQEKYFEQLQVKMLKRLLRSRVLEKFRLLNKYHTIAIDGLCVYTFDYPHCEHCLVREDESGKKHWFHYKLQASLVTPSGLCLSLANEWIENEVNYNKQDCELRAFYRLIEKIRLLYSRLPICVLLDGFDCV